MRTLGFTSWLSLVALTAAGIAGTYLTCPGCIDRSRANDRCEWTGDNRFELDVRDAAHWRHLIADAQVAEEIAVRTGDAEFPRRYWPGAGDLHEKNARAQIACLDRLNAFVEDLHGVTPLQRTMANQQRKRLFDLLVVLSFLPLYSFGIGCVCERFRNLLGADLLFVRVLAVGMGSVFFSALGLVAFRLWWAMMEGMRVGNPDGHFGFRAAAQNYWSLPYVASWFAGGTVLFWIVAFVLGPSLENPPPCVNETTLNKGTA